MNYKRIASGVMDTETKTVVGVVFKIDDGLFVRILADAPRPAYAWSPMLYGKWDPYRVECPAEKVPQDVLDTAVAALASIEKPNPMDIMGGHATYDRIVQLFGEIE